MHRQLPHALELHGVLWPHFLAEMTKSRYPALVTNKIPLLSQAESRRRSHECQPGPSAGLSIGYPYGVHRSRPLCPFHVYLSWTDFSDDLIRVAVGLCCRARTRHRSVSLLYAAPWRYIPSERRSKEQPRAHSIALVREDLGNARCQGSDGKAIVMGRRLPR